MIRRWTLGCLAALWLVGCATTPDDTEAVAPDDYAADQQAELDRIWKEYHEAVATLPACGPKSYVVLLESPDGTTGKVVVRGRRGDQIITRARWGVPIDGSIAAVPFAEKRIRDEFGAAMAVRPKIPAHYLLHFGDGATLTGESEAMIPRIVAEAADRPVPDVAVIGHTDTLRSEDYNERLGMKRANRVAQLLRNDGLRAHTLAVESHGERNLLVATPDHVREPRNRRVEVSIR